MKKYSEIRDQLKTGDLVLFSGRSPISRLIQFGTRSKWSHVGMVIKSDMGLCLWESTTLSNLDDLDSGRAVQGVQSVFLSDRIRTYPGAIAIRPIKTDAIKEDDKNTLSVFRNEVKGRPYEQDKRQLVLSALDMIDGQCAPDLSSIFCSELVAAALQQVALLSEHLPAHEYTPADFARPVIPGDHFNSYRSQLVEVAA